MTDRLTKINAIAENEVAHKNRVTKLNGMIESEIDHHDRLTKLNGMIESEIDHHDRLSKIVVMVEYVERLLGPKVMILPSLCTVSVHDEVISIQPFGRT